MDKEGRRLLMVVGGSVVALAALLGVMDQVFGYDLGEIFDASASDTSTPPEAPQMTPEELADRKYQLNQYDQLTPGEPKQ